jgi:hypothetical protein
MLSSRLIVLKNLLACFRAFIKRGSILEWCKVLPEEISASDVNKAIRKVRTSAKNPDVIGTSPQTLPHQSQDALEPKAYFVHHMSVPNKNRIDRLSRIAIRTAGIKVAQRYATFTSALAFTRHTTCSLTQATAMYDAIRAIPDAADIKYRFALLTFGHVIDRYAALLSRRSLRLPTPRNPSLRRCTTTPWYISNVLELVGLDP